MKTTQNAANERATDRARPPGGPVVGTNIQQPTGRLRPAMAALLGVGLFAVVGCSLPEAQPDLTRFYVLSSPVPKTDAAASAASASPAPRIVLRPIVVPEFLRGKIMLVRLGENEVRFIDQARWAEPLEAGLTRVVRESLMRGSGVDVLGRGGDEHDFDVAILLRRYEGALPAGAARLSAHIEIFSIGLEPKLVAQEDFTTEIPGWEGKDYGDLAKKLSEAADALARRIAALLAAAKK